MDRKGARALLAWLERRKAGEVRSYYIVGMIAGKPGVAKVTEVKHVVAIEPMP